jgi:hypothetical protein
MRQFLREVIFRARLAWHESDLRGIDVAMQQLEADRAARVARIQAIRFGAGAGR